MSKKIGAPSEAGVSTGREALATGCRDDDQPGCKNSTDHLKIWPFAKGGEIMCPPDHILGIDFGAIAAAAALINNRREVVQSAYRFHRGDIRACLQELLQEVDWGKIRGIAATRSTPVTVKSTRQYDNMLCLIEACRFFHARFGAILVVGGEKFGLIRFDAAGNYRSYKANSACAAGTGSFLDQQAQRLNLSGIAELSRIALTNTGALPKIASRCAVFAKTDLVHAQQQGYTLAEICDGLCYGLAKNIADGLFGAQPCRDPVIFTGGVSRNKAVVKHLAALTSRQLIAEDTHLYGAIGAALCLHLESEERSTFYRKRTSAGDVLYRSPARRTYAYDPLELKYSDYPDFVSLEKYTFSASRSSERNPLEVDTYTELRAAQPLSAYLGIDIGSTSTKATLSDPAHSVLAGFYTRTAGQPMEAVRQLFAAIDDMIAKKGLELRIIGAATTGSGRKFIGKMIGADLIIDEISAHARAAVALDSKVDTIIEIGGQDSKFTTLQNGRVTFASMNTVCAAGTGSFIEEQCLKLGCPLSECATRTVHRKSPLTSDRCTVFMERDLNHYLSAGYDVDEVLAAVLHSITENYLTKVAVESGIGNAIFFQGATAKIKSLVAAFEQRLQKPIHVSKYCHLTGALGAAISLADAPPVQTGFRGIRLHHTHIPLRSERCPLCTNHCKITVAEIDGDRVAYGFLCGRDDDTPHYVDNNRSGFDLAKARKQAFASTPQKNYRHGMTIGIPATLQLFEDLFFWRSFFDALGIQTLISEGVVDAIGVGKQIAGADFCAPLTALHGHVLCLQRKMKELTLAGNRHFIFLPIYLEQKTPDKGLRRHYCYYTQYAAALAADIGAADSGSNFLSPLVSYLYSRFHTKAELYRVLKPLTHRQIRFKEVSDAYERAMDLKQAGLLELRNTYRRETVDCREIHVVLLGRPYTVLDSSMNKGIPDMFASLGIKTFYQDMLTYGPQDLVAIEPMLAALHWRYASEILSAAEVTAETKGAYPVLITSFKCSPDAFVIDYFKKVMESHNKPYLILQLDEHTTSAGYETRVEAAIRSFKNHFLVASPKTAITQQPLPRRENIGRLADKTLVFPNWDSLSLRLVVANLIRAGFDARLLEENQARIQKSMRTNSGQCLPLNIIAQEFIDYIETRGLDPEKTVLWMVDSEIACNIKLYPHHIRTILNAHGQGMEKAGVYVGGLSLADISLKLPVQTYFAYMFGGFVRKIGCKLRPYERTKGTTDRVIEENLRILEKAFLHNRSKTAALAEVVTNFEHIELTADIYRAGRPKVAIFGDLYARDNPVMNQDLIHFIEANGAEVVTTPYSCYVKMIAKPYLHKWWIEGRYWSVLGSKALLAELMRREKGYYRLLNRILREPEALYDESPQKILAEYHLRMEHSGESMDNILKIYYLKKYHPDISLFVQTSPAFCCPSLITEAMARKIEAKTGIPIVSITYDGTAGDKNHVIVPYLKTSRHHSHESHRSMGFD
jgi:predicted CoA-substrate-specific enzyme activase